MDVIDHIAENKTVNEVTDAARDDEHARRARHPCVVLIAEQKHEQRCHKPYRQYDQKPRKPGKKAECRAVVFKVTELQKARNARHAADGL